jgi:putative membrane protein
MDYLNYQLLGMHFIWWFLWIFILIWIFATPYEIPGQRSKKESPLDILKKRYAAGQISKDEYLESKKTLELC